jgi:hypothetical protein
VSVEEFDGCTRACRKTRVHTLVWGDCERAPESARPEPTLTVMRRRVLEDGYPALVGESVTLSALAGQIEKALRSVPVRLGPNALTLLRNGKTVGLSGGEYAAMALAVAMDLVEEGK